MENGCITVNKMSSQQGLVCLRPCWYCHSLLCPKILQWHFQIQTNQKSINFLAEHVPNFTLAFQFQLVFAPSTQILHPKLVIILYSYFLFPSFLRRQKSWELSFENCLSDTAIFILWTLEWWLAPLWDIYHLNTYTLEALSLENLASCCRCSNYKTHISIALLLTKIQELRDNARGPWVQS